MIRDRPPLGTGIFLLMTPNGDRIVEIGAVELINRSPTGQTYHRYLCPLRDITADAVAVHGLTAEFLADKPLFADRRVPSVRRRRAVCGAKCEPIY